MVRYPDELVLTWQEDGTFAAGDYTAGDEVTYTIAGRAEINGKGSLITTPDGAQVVYEFMFHCDKQEFEAPFGTKAELSNWQGTVKGQSNDQTGTRIWL